MTHDRPARLENRSGAYTVPAAPSLGPRVTDSVAELHSAGSAPGLAAAPVSTPLPGWPFTAPPPGAAVTDVVGLALRLDGGRRCLGAAGRREQRADGDRRGGGPTAESMERASTPSARQGRCAVPVAE
jgi:hypothetical protein